MLKEESTGLDDGGDNWARVCDTCRSAACTVYCRADSAYLCTDCDGRIHAANRVASRHERVWVCEACERAPAAFLCRADAASLCTTCDADVHSANPLARRHHRIPILPIPGCLYGPPATDPGSIGVSVADTNNSFLVQDGDETLDEEDEDEAASWLLLNPVKDNEINNKNHQNNNMFHLFGEEVDDEYLDLADYNSCQDNQFTEQYSNQQQQYSVPHKSYGGDSVVPVQREEGKDQLQQQESHNFDLAMEFETSKTGYGYPASITHTVSISSMDVAVVPVAAMRDVSISHTRPPKGTIDLFSCPSIQMPTQLTPIDREARVLRYREKKKTRKFEKTIRYASRKAYAETRPRVKGRFAKRTDIGVEVEQMFSTNLMAESGYGVVPSF